jgi:UDP-glucose 4-epimerase
MALDLGRFLKNKTILVTGGTGSFGGEVVRKLLSCNPRKVVVFSRDEKKQFDMNNKFNDDRLKFIVGDVRERQSIEHAMHGVDMVFHAAALKQVPNCEFFPIEAVRTNILGSFNVVNAAIDGGVKNLVLLSTDKAVYPVSVMGMSKALAERAMIAAFRQDRGSTTLSGTRYGNVMYTRGSVIPFFVSQMKARKPLSVTNKDMTRFMMSLNDSVDLVLFALVNGKDGEIYVRKSPAATVGDVAQALVELFKYKKGIVDIGIRPGEKTHETLVSSEELRRTSDMGNYYKISPELPKIDSREYFFKGENKPNIPDEGYTSANTVRLTVKEVKKLLLSLPEIKQELNLLKKGNFYK